MKKLFIGGLALALLVSASENAAAQEEKKMTRDEYVAQMADLTGREGTAKGQIETLDAEIEALKAQLAQLDRDNADLNAQILTAVSATDAQVKAFGKNLDSIAAQLEGLLALAPEVLIQRRGEVNDLAAQAGELKESKISALPEMAAKLADIDKMIAQLKARVAQPVTIDYTVAKGDNLWNISKMERIYADPYMWPRLYRANKEQIQDPDLIYPDQTLAVPFGVAENQHLVTRGDFLFKIAAEVYNDGGKWHKIYEANKQQIVEPHLIFPAQVLELPSN
ncbi:LysM peptidoglycan-binding domain-containing protein [bacterium]|nr:LysM peptidoglycan-binding domain-containing protein [bacterium]